MTKGYQGKCQLCGVFGDSAKRCSQMQQQYSGSQQSYSGSHSGLLPSPFRPWQPRANLALGTSQQVNPWLLDSGATHHMTSDLHNLAIHQPYNGEDAVLVGDGSGIPITHTGSLSLPSPSLSNRKFTLNTSIKPPLVDWHHRLGHLSFPILKNVVSSSSLPHMQSLTSSSLCSDCSINKAHKLPFSQTSIVSTRPLEYIFSDVWSSPIVSIDNFKYYVIFVDHYTRYTWLYPLKTKSQVRETFIPFKELVENRFNTRIGTLYSDNGGEFIALRSFLESAGISHLTSPPHTPEHNGISERKHRHVVETGLTLLTHSGIPKSYWPYAFAAAVYLINRLPSPVLEMVSPF